MTETLEAVRSAAAVEAAEALAQFTAKRQPELFEPLMRLHAKKVASCIYNIVNNPSLTDDLTQEAFIRAYQKFDSFNGKASFSTWICRIGMNLAISHLRKESKWKNSAMPEEALQGRPQDRPDHQIQVREARSRIDLAMDELSPPLRAALVMSAVENVPIDDIAVALDCPKATVYWRIHKARKILKQILSAGA